MMDALRPFSEDRQIRMQHHPKNCCLSAAVLAAVLMTAAASRTGLGQNLAQESDFFQLLENDLQIETKEMPNLTAEPNTVTITEKTAAIDKQAASSDLIHLLPPPRTAALTAQQQVWQARISASPSFSSNPTKEELEGLIRRIRSIEIKPKMPAEPTAAVSVPAPAEKPAEKSAGGEPQQADDAGIVKTAAADGRISAQTLALFRQSAQHPNALKNPYQLGEILYEGGCLKEAAICYKEALNRLNSQPTSADDKAWLLLRLGDCLRADNPAEALDSYRRVIQDYPNSPWTALAKTKSMWVEWNLQVQPRKLIEQNPLSTAEEIESK
ncbi:MAG TPA: tetratricopeptide repeat protein [Anaerohalosphaeraceae bacterium]|nr:tetratricopeptide repeat protein [Anaerohalosphaeraceae bacterium]HOM75398.1 tetratricopeptide repeat protein [Anaerohalosphaeraceae bacterium]HPC63042.1 tetratricopeptide repeat protein [Anaerohalosphaeraceae bacterium]